MLKRNEHWGRRFPACPGVGSIQQRRTSCWFAAIQLLLLLATPWRSFADVAGSDPARQTRAIVAQAVAILHATSISPARRRAALIKLAANKFDFARMARGSLGSHWGELTPAERERFVSLFTGFFEAAYLSKIQDYANLDIRVGAEKFSDHNLAQVDASVIQPGEDTIPITFMLAQRGNDWMVYDVAIENVGMIENYRAQFDRVIQAHGISQLMADLQAKQAHLRAGLGAGPGAS
jgi:phospholipid transport system substrate-binding protein